MSVIIGRALPDVRDGLKPANRRVLFGMHEMGLQPGRGLPQVRGHRGRRDGQVPPARRRRHLRHPGAHGPGLQHARARWWTARATSAPWTATRPRPCATPRPASPGVGAMMADIDKETVDFVPNYDDRLHRADGAAHRRSPTCWSTARRASRWAWPPRSRPTTWARWWRRSPSCSRTRTSRPTSGWKGVMERIPGPDFPTAGFICGRAGIRQAYRTGRGSMVMRARAEIETRKGDKESIVVTEIPYQVNKARLIERIAELVRDKKLDGIADIRDESDRQGMRIVLDIRKGEPSQVILNNLYKHTPLQDTFGIIMLAIVDQRPAGAEPAGGLRAVPGLPPRGGAPAHRLRAAQGGGAGPRPGRAGHRPRPPGRGDRAHPRARHAGRGPGRPGHAVRPDRDPGRRHPGDAAPAPDRPGAPEDRGRARARSGADRQPQGHPGHARAHRRHHPATSCRRSGTTTATRAAP